VELALELQRGQWDPGPPGVSILVFVELALEPHHGSGRRWDRDPFQSLFLWNWRSNVEAKIDDARAR